MRLRLPARPRLCAAQHGDDGTAHDDFRAGQAADQGRYDMPDASGKGSGLRPAIIARHSESLLHRQACENARECPIATFNSTCTDTETLKSFDTKRHKTT